MCQKAGRVWLVATPVSLALIHIAPMADARNVDVTGFIVDHVNDSILSHSDAP